MDVYGYPSYQYNQSDEMAKQLLAHQALASSTPYSQEEPQPRTLPMPPEVPWNSRDLPWGLSSPPQVVQFTAQPEPYKDNKFSPVVHCKRKSLDVDPGIPTKQLITEEKMAAHLSGLHISSQYTSHTLAQTTDELMDVWMDTINCEKLKGHTIVLSEEVKKIQEEPILPPSIIDRLEKPNMSLVVWKPRESILGIKEQEEKKEEEQFPRKRNGVLVPDDMRIMDDVEM